MTHAIVFFFFFQAEDGIRDLTVTGVQTCALPIWLERLVADGSFRGCPYVNAVTELGDPRHPASKLAVQFKEQRRLWYRALLERLAARHPDALATQLQILFEGALAGALVRGDPALARSARDAAEVLLAAAGVRRARPAGVRRPPRPRRRSARRS